MPALAGPAALAALRAGRLGEVRDLDLRGCGLTRLPAEVMSLGDRLQRLDLSDNRLTALPAGLERLQGLHTLFASQNRFTELPRVLGRLPALDTLGFKANRIERVAGEALSPHLRWLILTDNRIAELPDSLTRCTRMQKLMLAGNRLTRLPAGLERLQRLELLRLSANAFAHEAEALTPEVLGLPRLAWLAHAGNPYNRPRETQVRSQAAVPGVCWTSLEVAERLGEGASGHIHAARWQQPDGRMREVALKLFKGEVTSDGWPDSEMAAGLAAGDHPNLAGVAGRLQGHPEGRQGLLMRRLPAGCAALAGPPSMASCSRDVYRAGWTLSAQRAAEIGDAVAAGLTHLHRRGLGHGDLYVHNTLLLPDGRVVLSDLGAAAFLPEDPGRRAAVQRLDERALDILRQELAERVVG